MSTTAYDAQSRPAAWTDALGDVWSLTYDAAGRVVTASDPVGSSTTYGYDDAGQLTSIGYSDGTPAVTFLYDADGRRVSMTDGTGTTTYVWDARSRLGSATDGAGHTVTSTWDARGGLIRMTYPDGLIVQQDHDALGRLTTVRDGAGHTNTFVWDADSRLVGSVLGDGTTTERVYDANGWLTSMTSTAAGASAPFARDTYERDATGRPALIGSASADEPVAATYDVRGRLTGLGADTFALDAGGQLTRLRGRKLSYDAAGRLETAVGTSRDAYRFDAAGRRLTGGTASYSYDAAGRLSTVQDPSAGIATTYAYNGDGLRTSAMDTSGVTTAFAWELAATGPRLLDDGQDRFIYGPGGMPIEQVDHDGTATWLHADATGSTRTLTTADGAVAATFTWDAYGVLTASTGAPDTRIGFQGQYTDPGTGLQYLQARYYDPATAQFLTMDPGLIATHHPYAFAAGDPLSFSDPSGVDPQIIWGKGKGRNVLAGHGTLNPDSDRVVVPAGTTVIFHQPAGSPMTDALGLEVEDNRPTTYTETYGPGSIIPDYTLHRPDGLNLRPTSSRSTGDLNLSQILRPGMGTVHWAACRIPSEASHTIIKDPASNAVILEIRIGHTDAPTWDIGGPMPGPYGDDRGMVPDPAWYDWDSGSILPEA